VWITGRAAAKYPDSLTVRRDARELIAKVQRCRRSLQLLAGGVTGFLPVYGALAISKALDRIEADMEKAIDLTVVN
jgi:hypothetical protein